MKVVTPQNAIECTSEFTLVDHLPVVVDLDRSHGNRLVDARDGREWLDCISYIASHPIGHNHPKMFEQGFEKKLLKAARNKVSNSDYFTVELASFVQTFARVAKPSSFKHLFFVEGGALAVENAIKTAFDWKVRKNQAKGLSSELGTRVIHFRQAFHGRSGYTLSLTNTADLRKIKYFPKFDWPRIINPKLHFPLTTEKTKAVEAVEQQAIQQILAAFKQYPDDIAAIIIEPIQGEGGDNHFRQEFHHALRRLADENEAMLIYDEVQSGLGLTGKMWAFEHYGIIPDIVSFGKKTQVCGIMCGSRVEEVPNHVFSEPSRLNSTWGGSLVDMVRSERYLEIIEEENLVENANSVGAYLQGKLIELTNAFPLLFSNARGKGLMCAIDLDTPAHRDEMFKLCFNGGLLLLKSGDRSLRLRPGLAFSRSDVDEVIAILIAGAKTL